MGDAVLMPLSVQLKGGDTMSHTVTLSIQSCNDLHELRSYLVGRRPDQEANEDTIDNWLGILTHILDEAAEDGWHAPSEDVEGLHSVHHHHHPEPDPEDFNIEPGFQERLKDIQVTRIIVHRDGLEIQGTQLDGVTTWIWLHCRHDVNLTWSRLGFDDED